MRDREDINALARVLVDRLGTPDATMLTYEMLSILEARSAPPTYELSETVMKALEEAAAEQKPKPRHLRLVK